MRTLSLVALAAISSGVAQAGELLHMPFACRFDGVRVRLLPSEDRAYRVIGPRQREIHTACAPDDPSRCRSWFVHRFEVECDGARVSWLDVAEAAAREGGRAAWVEDGRFSVRMGRLWSVARDDGPGFGRRRWRDALDEFGPGFNGGRGERYIVTMPPGFAPALGVPIAFSGDDGGARETMSEEGPPAVAAGPADDRDFEYRGFADRAPAELPRERAAPPAAAEDGPWDFSAPAENAPEPSARAAPTAPPDVAVPAAAPEEPAPAPELPQKAPRRPPPGAAPVETATVATPPSVAPSAEAEPKSKVTVVKPTPPAQPEPSQTAANAPVATSVPGAVKPVIINAPQSPAAPSPAPPADAPQTAMVEPALKPPAASAPEPSDTPSAQASREPPAAAPPAPEPVEPETTGSMETAASDLPPPVGPLPLPSFAAPDFGSEAGIATMVASAAVLALSALAAFGLWRWWTRGDTMWAPPEERDLASVSLGGVPRPEVVLPGLDRVPVPARREPTPAPAAGPEVVKSEGELPVPTTYEQALQVLGVNADATLEAIKKIVDGLRRSWHPDHAKSEADRSYREQRLRQINVAWDLVSQKRSAA